MPPRTSVQLLARTVLILAEAYELDPADVEHDVALLQAWPAWALCTLVWLKERHRWHASTCVYYLARLHRAVHGQPPFG
jgi:hypothetical protein